MHIHVVIATTGRPAILKQVITRLAMQTRPADAVTVVGASPRDVDGLEGALPGMEVILSERGLCKQRNAALDRIEGKSDIVVFFDDDFVAEHDFLRNLEDIFETRGEVVGVTGILVDDGSQSVPLSFEEAAARLDLRGERPRHRSEPCLSLYGCNMAFRSSAAKGLRFDEKLPLYGWQEDVDFTHQLSWRGTLLRTSRLTGIHMGARSGKTSGKRLGYSQIANIVYLWRKGTMRPWHGQKLLFQNIVSNLIRSLWPEPDIDRHGRLAGNLLAITDLLKGRIDPQRIESL